MNPPPSIQILGNFRLWIRFPSRFQMPSFIVDCSTGRYPDKKAEATMSNVPLKDKPRPIARVLAYFFLYVPACNIAGQVAPRMGRVN